MKSTESSQEKPPPTSRPAGHGAGTEPGEAAKPDGIRDTVESIIVAFILAFVFRAFVVEAFVIPTGSMAPGLYGKHGEYRCRACQYSFAYGITDTMRNQRGERVPGLLDQSQGFSVACPNCGWLELKDPQSYVNQAPLGGWNVVAESGDRILVLKWPYDIGGDVLGPKRWDAVVFKDPEDGDTNFIKRLLGLPGEVVEIIDGDLYVAPVSAVDPDIQAALLVPPRSPDQGGSPRERRLDKDQVQRLARFLRIQHKTRIAQESLWMLHYDHDYLPDPKFRSANPQYNPPRWEPQDGGQEGSWDSSTPCIRFKPKDHEIHWLKLAGRPIGDQYGYNNVCRPDGARPDAGSPVGDVRLSFVLFAEGGKASLCLKLRKGNDEFRATLQADGTAILEKPIGSARTEAVPGRESQNTYIPIQAREGAFPPLEPGKPHTIEFENVDYRVSLRMDGDEILATTDADYAPDIPALLAAFDRQEASAPASVEIGAEGTPMELRHVAVYRDVYYQSGRNVALANDSARGASNPLKEYPGWGTTGNPILLRTNPPDYFCCGDNSPQSKDSRLWWEVCPMLRERKGDMAYQQGTVPGDQMIGRAFFVYWPSGLRFSKDTPAVIPNVGRMRIIR